MARLDIGVEAGRITLTLEVPQADLAGFERAPRTDAERAVLTAAIDRLREPARLVRIDGGAGCDAGRADVKPPAWGGGDKPAGAHADLEATYEFACREAARAGFVEVTFFEALPRLQRIDVRAATGRGQLKAVLRRPQARITLVR